MELLSVIVPCYNEEENVPYFYEEFCKNAGFLQEKQIDFEILYVDDGSKDGTVEEVRKLHEKDGRVRLLSFSRNFGKEAAMYAGLEKAKGDYVVIMDADLQEYNRFTKGIYGWVGFNTKWIEFENVERLKGETKWNFWKLLLYSIDGITAFSTMPLSIASFMGVLFCVLAFVLIIFIVIRTLIFGDPVSGWPSLVCIISLISGVQLFCLGIVGQYLAKTYMEVKKRPIYLLKEEL